MNKLRVITKKDSQTTGNEEDGFLEKVVKYIPTEIVAAYTAFRSIILPNVSDAEAILPYGGDDNCLAFKIAFYVGLVFTPLYKYRTLKDPTLGIPYYQIAISTLAFVVWVFAFGDFFELSFESWYKHQIGAMMLIAFSLAVPIVEDFFVKH